MPEIVMCSRTSQGRRSANEDSLCLGLTQAGWYAVIADGAGGHRRGDEASLRTVRAIEGMFDSASAAAFAPETLSRIIANAHAELQRHQIPGNPAASMHSTVVALWIDYRACYALWAHVGDSRLYRIRHGLVDVVTSDDSVVQQMVAAGLISRDQARHHPNKNQLVAALGIEGDVDPHTVVRPVELKEGDAYLLCSDGWWDALDPMTLESTLEQSRTADEWLEVMAQRIEALQSPRQDNYSAIAVWAGDPARHGDDAQDDTVPRSGR